MISEDKEQLVDAAREGDAEAFAALVRLHERSVYGLAFATVRDRAAADDITQDAFVVAWTQLKKLQNSGAFSMWLRKIARNLALNWIRSARYREALANRHREQSPERAHAADPTLEIMSEERRAALLKALGALSAPVREAILVFYLEGQSVGEAARQLGISENALKLRLHNGRKRLREHIETQLDEQLADMLRPAFAQQRASRILAGIAAGPVLPDLAESAAEGGLKLWLHQCTHETIPSAWANAASGSFASGTAKFAVVTVAALAGIGGAYWTLVDAHNRSNDGRGLQAAKSANTLRDEMLALHSKGQPLESGATTDAGPPRGEDTVSTSLGSHPTSPIAAGPSSESTYTLTGASVAIGSLAGLLEAGRISDPSDFAYVSGTVVDSTGYPVAGAIVTILASGLDSETSDIEVRGAYAAVQQSRSHRYLTVSDVNGRYSISSIAYEGMARISAVAEGFVQSRESNAPIELRPGDALEPVDLILEPGFGLRGIVLAPDGAAVSDAVVTVVAYRSANFERNGLLASALADAGGEFYLGFEAPGMVSLVVSSESHGHASFDDVVVGGDEVVELIMRADATLEGTVTWSDGEAAEGVYVFLEGRANDGTGDRRIPASAAAGQVDSTGDYTVSALDANQRYVAVIRSAEGTPLSNFESIGPLQPGLKTRWDHVIHNTAVITGTVYGETTGRPLRDILVACRREATQSDEIWTHIKPDGSYELRITSEPGTYWVYPRLARMDPAELGFEYGREVQLEPGSTMPLDLVFADTVTMSVLVVDETGRPMEGLALGIHEGDHTWVPLAETPADGRFTWSGFAPGKETNFVVYRGSTMVGSSSPRIGDPGQVFPEETIVVHGDAGLEATLTDPSGEPLANVRVEISVLFGADERIVRTVNTDEGGHLLINGGLPATTVTLHVVGTTRTEDRIATYTGSVGPLDLLDQQIRNVGQVPMDLKPLPDVLS